MNPWFARAAVLLAAIGLIVIRAPHGQRSRAMVTKASGKSAVERALLVLAMLSFFLPLLWAILGVPAAADYPLRPVPYGMGVAAIVVGLWLFARSHADLGTNWSITLEVREGHRLVTHGVYRAIRHPMYTALLLYSVGFVLVLPNWVAGPSYLVSMLLLVAFRLGPEERLMRAEFGPAYDEYARRTKRLIPGVW